VAALGAGLVISNPEANMIVDIGGGTSDIGILSLSGIVYSRSIRVGGNEMDDAIMQHLKREHGLLIGERTAEKIKIEIGSAGTLDRPLTIDVKGRDLITGLPKVVVVTDAEIRVALQECVQVIVDAVRSALERIPPELSGDLTECGIVLTGGGAMLRQLDSRLRMETGLPMTVAEDPLSSVVAGTGKMLSDFKLLRRVSIH
jgi:rod shape-determining protein MreB